MHNADKFILKYWSSLRKKYIQGNWNSLQRGRMPPALEITFAGFPQDMREICRNIENPEDIPGKYLYTITVLLKR